MTVSKFDLAILDLYPALFGGGDGGDSTGSGNRDEKEKDWLHNDSLNTVC